MKFFWGKEETTLREILIELVNQYVDNFQHLGLNYYNKTIQPNVELLFMVIKELKDDSELELNKILRDK